MRCLEPVKKKSSCVEDVVNECDLLMEKKTGEFVSAQWLGISTHKLSSRWAAARSRHALPTKHATYMAFDTAWTVWSSSQCTRIPCKLYCSS